MASGRQDLEAFVKAALTHGSSMGAFRQGLRLPAVLGYCESSAPDAVSLWGIAGNLLP
jgi:hypothetical protein